MTIPALSEAASEAASGRLGKRANRVSAPAPSGVSPRAEEARARRYKLLDYAAQLQPGSRTARCHRVATGHLVHVNHHAAGGGSASFAGLVTCGSVWSCPVCQAKISERRRHDLGETIQRWQALGDGYRVIMVTFTVRHRRGHSLLRTLTGLLNARRKMVQGRKARDFDQAHGIGGRVKALEVTHGVNGWHPHLHELWFLEPGSELPTLIPAVKELWSGMVSAVGAGTVNGHGVNVEVAQWSAAEYVAKFGRDREVETDWTLAHEMAKANVKEGRESGRTPTGLLADFAWNGDAAAGALWQEFAATMKGRKQLTWSKGLRERLGLRELKTDAEVAEEATSSATLVVSLTLADWRGVLALDARAELLAVASGGSSTDVSAFLHRLGVWRYASPD